MVAAIKNLIASILYYSGLFKIILQVRLRHKAVVLMYHQVISNAGQSLTMLPGMFVYKDTFEKHINCLKKNLRIISFPEMIAKIRNGEDISGCCIITFDDGWKDFYEEAFPVLKKFGTKATVFLATGLIDSDSTFWFEETRLNLKDNLEDCIQMIKKSNLLPGCINSRSYPINIVIDDIIERMKNIELSKREELINKLREMNSYKRSYHSMMRWDDAIDMLSSGLINFGAHTIHHVMLDQVDMDTAEHEIIDSIEVVRTRLNVDEKIFSYPNGNYNEKIIQILRKNGVDCAVTTKKGYVDNNTNLMLIPRIGMHEDISLTIPRFLARITLPGF